MTQEFEWSIRVYYEDTDAGGVVYYANYLKFYERARSEWLNQLKINQTQLLDQGIAFVVTRAEVDYLRPARLNQSLLVTSCIDKVTAATVSFEQKLWLCDQNHLNKRELLNQASIKVACLKLNTFLPCRLPALVKEELQRVS
ncbi:MAG: YbgC/FadM family acyl-CoA thioesterase [Enterobacterales bacterium]|nr:YbgC/FadM family acyl-CoA thioesterase [Enterobacterales bacterium]